MLEVVVHIVLGVAIFLGGVALEYVAGYALDESSKPAIKGDAAILYGCMFTACILGGVLMLITGAYVVVKAFVA